MADISIIHEGNADYKVKDAAGRLALAEVENKGAKNLLKNKRATTTHKGITFTINDDGSVTANGTNDNTGASVLDINTQTSLALSNGDYILTGCPAGGSDSGYMMDVTRSPGSSIKDTGSGATFTVGGDYTVTEFRIVISRNVTVDNLKFYPMICTKAEWDISQAYVPYGKTNAELTSDISALSTENISQQAEINYAVNAGAKNLLKYRKDVTSLSAGNVYARTNSDGTLSVGLTSGTTATAQLVFTLGSITKYRDRKLILSGCPAGGNYKSGYALYVSNNGSTAQADIGSGATLPIVTGVTSSVVALIVRNGTTISSELTFRPMVRNASIVDSTFQPFARTNRDLTVLTDEDREALVELVDGGAKNLLKFESLSQDHRNGVDYTLNSDGSVTVNGTPSGTSESYVALTIGTAIAYDASEFCDGNHIISGCPSGGGESSYRIQVAKSNYAVYDYGSGAVLTPTTLTGVAILIYIPNGVTANNLVFRPMICTTSAWKISKTFQPYRLPYQEISDTVQALKKAHHYGFIIDKNNSDSYTAVSYTHGAVGFSPAYMDYTNNKFVYGSWADAWFIRDAVPVALNFDGTEAFELDKSDFTKKADGTASGIDCISMVLTDSQPSDWATNWKWYYTKSGDYYVGITESSAPTWAANTYYRAVSAIDANFMLRMPKVYFKRANDEGHNYIEISDRALDSDFHAYAHIDANGVEKDYIYLPLFKGSMINGKLRSVPNVWPKNFTTAQNEIDAAAALGTGWQIWDHSSRELINDLLILISKSLDCQTTFGRGRESGYVGNKNQNYGLLKTGSLIDKGMFYGYSSFTAEVKVFGMESFWANRWDRMLGLILKDNVWKVKMQPPYNLTADGYATPSGVSTPSVNEYFKSVHSSEYGSVPDTSGGEASKYYRDYFYKNTSGTRVALVGGVCDGGAGGGFRCVGVSTGASYSYWSLGASPVYK